MTILVRRYRCVGKATGPDIQTTTTAMVSEEAANEAGVAMLEAGKWSEYYVKAVVSLHSSASPARMGPSEHGLPAPPAQPPGQSPRPGGSALRTARRYVPEEDLGDRRAGGGDG